MFTAIPMTLLSLLVLTSAAGSLSGNDFISVENYPDIGFNAPESPPFCGMAWESLDLSRITAVQGLTTDQCGTCLLVCGAEANACAYILAVDRGGRNLDLSTGISGDIIGTTDGIAWAKWQPVSGEYCNHIYRGGDNYGELPDPDELHSEGNTTTPSSSLSTTSNSIIANSTLTNPDASTSTTADYVSSVAVTPTPVTPSSIASGPIDSSSIPASDKMASILSTLISSFVTSTSSASATIWESIAYETRQPLNSTNAFSSSLLNSKNSTFSGYNGAGCGCSANLNSTITYDVGNTDYNFTSRYDMQPYTKAIRNVRGLRRYRYRQGT